MPAEADDRLLVVFVHGLGGHPDGTWRHRGLESLPERIERLTRTDVATHAYHTRLIRWNPFHPSPPNVQLLADGLNTALDLLHGEADHVVLACHSLGGLIARKALVERAQSGKPNRVRHLVLFATPNEGSDLARRGEWLSLRHRQLRQLMRDSEFLDELDRDWHQTGLDDHVGITAVYGARDTVVRAGSAQAHWGGLTVDQHADHSSLVKPQGDDAICVRVLVDVLERIRADVGDGLGSVERRNATPRLESPDTRLRGDRGHQRGATVVERRAPSAPQDGSELMRFLVQALGGAIGLAFGLFGAATAFGADHSFVALGGGSVIGALGVFIVLLPLLWWLRPGHRWWSVRTSASLTVAGAILVVLGVVVARTGQLDPEPEPDDLVVAVSRVEPSSPELGGFAGELHDKVVEQLRGADFVGDVEVVVPDEVLNAESVAAWVTAQPFTVAVVLYGRVEPSPANGERVTWSLHSNSRAPSSFVPLVVSEQFGDARILTLQQVRAGELGGAFAALVHTLEALEALGADASGVARGRVDAAQRALIPEGGDEEDLFDAQVPDVLWALDAFIDLIEASETLDRTGVAEVLERLGRGLRVDPLTAGLDDVESPFALATLLTTRYLSLFPVTASFDHVQPCPGTPEFDRETEAVEELLAGVDPSAVDALRSTVDEVAAVADAPVVIATGLMLQSRVLLLDLLTSGTVSPGEVLAPALQLIDRFGDQAELDLDVWVADAHGFVGLLERSVGRPFEAIVSLRRAQAIATPFYEAQALADSGVLLRCDLADSPDSELVELAAACHFREAAEIGTGLASVDRDLRDAWHDRGEDCSGDSASLVACLLARAAQRAGAAGQPEQIARASALYSDYLSAVSAAVMPVPGWCTEVIPPSID